MNELDRMRQIRDRRLRRWILRMLHNARPQSMRGHTLWEMLRSTMRESEGPEDQRHVERLLADLVDAGLVAEKDCRQHTDQRRTLDVLAYFITADGTGLIEQVVEPHPLVEDDRIRS